MLIPEACQLVLQASAMGRDGEVMVLEMGEQVRIAEVARTLIRLSGRRDVDIVYTGLRPGEKLTEELFGRDEQRHHTSHPLIDSVAVPPLDPSALRRMTCTEAAGVSAWMRATVAAKSLDSRACSPSAPEHRAQGTQQDEDV